MAATDVQTEVTTQRSGAIHVLHVCGALTSGAAAPLMEAYAAAHGTPYVVLDFVRATTINSAGIALVLRIATECARRNQQIAFSGCDGHFSTLFHMAGLPQFGTMHASSTDAITAFGEQMQRKDRG